MLIVAAVVTASMTWEACVANTRTCGSGMYPHSTVEPDSSDVREAIVAAQLAPPCESSIQPGPSGAWGSSRQNTAYGLLSLPWTV